MTTGYEQPGDPAFEGGAAYERHREEITRRNAGTHIGPTASEYELSLVLRQLWQTGESYERIARMLLEKYNVTRRSEHISHVREANQDKAPQGAEEAASTAGGGQVAAPACLPSHERGADR